MAHPNSRKPPLRIPPNSAGPHLNVIHAARESTARHCEVGIPRIRHVHVHNDPIPADVRRVHLDASDSTRNVSHVHFGKLEVLEHSGHLCLQRHELIRSDNTGKGHLDLWNDEVVHEHLGVLPDVRPQLVDDLVEPLDPFGVWELHPCGQVL